MGEGGGEGAVEGDAAEVGDDQGDQAGRHHLCRHHFDLIFDRWIWFSSLLTLEQ